MECREWRTNVNTPDELLLANQWILGDQSGAGPQQFQRGTSPPNYIAPSATIGRGCLVGPHVSLGERVELGREVEVENCVLLDNVRVGEGAKLRNGIFGEGCRVAAGFVTPADAGPRIYAGDNQQVG